MVFGCVILVLERNLGFKSLILVFWERHLDFQEHNLGLWFSGA